MELLVVYFLVGEYEIHENFLSYIQGVVRA